MRETLPKQDNSTEKNLRMTASVAGVPAAQPPETVDVLWWMPAALAADRLSTGTLHH
jgi:hypothetical protein